MSSIHPSQTPGATPLPAPKKSNKKWPRAVKRGVVIVAILLALCAGAWAAWEFLVPRVELKTYEGDGYSLSVPAKYEERPSNGSYTFEEAGEADDDTRSSVSTQATTYATMGQDKEGAMALYDDLYNEEGFDETLSGVEGSEVRNFTKREQAVDGFDARRISFDLYDGEDKIRHVAVRLVFTDDVVYTVSMNIHSGDSKLAWTERRILNSLKITES